MTATAAQIAQLRRMVAEPTSATYSDLALTAYIETYPLLDERGQAPYTWDTATSPPTQDANDDWVPTYDLHAAAADVWEEKAGAETTSFDFGADGASYNRSQRYTQMMAQARYHRSRRSPKTGTLVKWPAEGTRWDPSWVANRMQTGT
jgi:hypothetical protein